DRGRVGGGGGGGGDAPRAGRRRRRIRAAGRGLRGRAVRTEMRRLLGLAWPEHAATFAAALLGFATLGSGVGLMATAAYLIARAGLHPPLGALQVAIVGARFLRRSRGLRRYLDRLVSHDVALRLLSRLRVFVYRALLPLAPAGLQQHRSGDLVGRLVADVETLEGLYTSVVG